MCYELHNCITGIMDASYTLREFESHSWRDALDATLRDKVCQWLTTGRWFSPGTPVSYTNKTDHYDIIEILLKVALNTIALTHYFSFISRKIWGIGKNDSDWKKRPESFIEYISHGRESNSYCNWGLGRNCIYACKIPLSYTNDQEV